MDWHILLTMVPASDQVVIILDCPTHKHFHPLCSVTPLSASSILLPLCYTYTYGISSPSPQPPNTSNTNTLTNQNLQPYHSFSSHDHTISAPFTIPLSWILLFPISFSLTLSVPQVIHLHCPHSVSFFIFHTKSHFPIKVFWFSTTSYNVFAHFTLLSFL